MVRIVGALFLCLMIGGGKPCGACWVRWWVEVFSQLLMFRLYHIFVMYAPYGVCFSSLFYRGGVGLCFCGGMV